MLCPPLGVSGTGTLSLKPHKYPKQIRCQSLDSSECEGIFQAKTSDRSGVSPLIHTFFTLDILIESSKTLLFPKK